MWENKRSRFKKPEQDYYSIANKLKSENKLYGANIWQNLPNIVQESVLKYAYSAARTKGEIASFLGINKSSLKKLLKKYDITNYFSKGDAKP